MAERILFLLNQVLEGKESPDEGKRITFKFLGKYITYASGSSIINLIIGYTNDNNKIFRSLYLFSVLFHFSSY